MYTIGCSTFVLFTEGSILQYFIYSIGLSFHRELSEIHKCSSLQFILLTLYIFMYQAGFFNFVEECLLFPNIGVNFVGTICTVVLCHYIDIVYR